MNKDINEARKDVLNTLLIDEFNTGAEEILNSLKEHNISEKDICINIQWNDKELEGKSEKEIDYIKKCREFINKQFIEYQIKAIGIAYNASEKLKTQEFKDSSEKYNALIEQNQKITTDALLSLIIQSVNWGSKTTADALNEHYSGIIAELNETIKLLKTLNKTNE